ncbi:type IV secretory system conjugative DNA transfer family protein [Candidatus Deianiraea vastatrix]|uniref:Type IV secretion system VirD4 n=1 Tax=Candidatus Deianiraea vastatrix TaxID=2163644 RepID=A0A5B8XF80_9RICK|nr:type IV secretory system conjugative DNA transfer family protein [Candidatus Deianiraea vastatrix]QED23943.1 Type IV secretion system VirD4 [Candidatus Deianiraea vastatrix]
MAKVFDPKKGNRKFQNFIIKGSIVFFFFFGLEYFGSIAFLSLMTNVAWMTQLFSNFVQNFDFVTHLNIVYQYTSKYLLYWWAYKNVIMFDNAGFILPKIIISFFIPHCIGLYIAIKNIRKFIDYEPVKKESSVHGDAHWATEKEIRLANLRAKDGVLMGMCPSGKPGKYLISSGFQHIMLFAPTGSGKGVGFAIPNTVFWRESFICHDIKLENFDLGSGWRKKHMNQDVYVWSPADSDGISHCYNPMDFVSKKYGQMVDDVQKLANLLLQKKEFWENEARTLGVGVMLYLCSDSRKQRSFGQVVRELRSDDFAYNIAVVLDTIGEKIHPVAYMNLAAWLQKPDKERGSVTSTLNSGLELWANPIIDQCTSRSDFNVQTFKKKPTTVFVGLTPDNIQRLKCLMAMFYQQSTEFLSKKMPGKDEPYGVLFLMDEFPTLGKLEQFLAGIAYFRGYRVRLFLIIQDTQQLKGTYEDAGMNSFLSNSTYRITFAANNVETAKLISELCGNQSVESDSYSKPRFFDLNPGSRSMSTSSTSRALLLPQEVISMDKDYQIILVEASSPIRTKKIKYYEDKSLTKKLIKKTPVPKQEITIKKPEKSKKPQSNDANSAPASTEALPSGTNTSNNAA